VVRGTPEERLLARLDLSGGPDACWPWTGSTNDRGYGLINVGPNGKHVLTHRLAYLLWVGPIPEREHLDPYCHDPEICKEGDGCPHRRCCNPGHLIPSSAKVNNARSGSPSAINAKREACKNGHEFTPANTYIHPKRGTRHCKECARRRTQEWTAANPEKMREIWNARYEKNSDAINARRRELYRRGKGAVA
jgi:hypothetical protein